MSAHGAAGAGLEGGAGQAWFASGRGLRLSGALLIGGFVLNALVTMLFHPSGDEDDHREIFTEYADSGAWIAVHLGQFVGVLVALGGLLVLYGVMRARGQALVLGGLAAAATVATAAAWAILQGLDGVALKQAVDAWVDSTGAQEAIRFDNAETVRWLEWGFQSYFRVLLGLALVLFGAALIATRLVAPWLGWLTIATGLLSAAIGVVVGYEGLENGFEVVASPVSQLALLVVAVGIFVTGRRAGYTAAATT